MERIWTAVAVLLLISVCEGDEVWEKDMSEDIYIEGSHEGFEHVKLRLDTYSQKAGFSQ
jgi:hypothetical protein